MRQFFKFIQNPKVNSKKEGRDRSLGKVIGSFFIFCFVVAVSYALLIIVINSIFGGILDFISSNRNTRNLNFILLNSLIIAPVVEELAFRLGLRLTRKFVAIGFGFQSMYVLDVFGVLDFHLQYILIAGLIFSGLFYLIINKKFLKFLFKHYNLYFFLSVFLFSIIHAFNYNYTNLFQWFYAPLLVLPQFFIGSYFAYIRVHYTLFWAILLHFLLNLLLNTDRLIGLFILN